MNPELIREPPLATTKHRQPVAWLFLTCPGCRFAAAVVTCHIATVVAVVTCHVATVAAVVIVHVDTVAAVVIVHVATVAVVVIVHVATVAGVRGGRRVVEKVGYVD